MPHPLQTTGFRAGALAGFSVLALSLGGVAIEKRAQAESCEVPGEAQALTRVLERFAPERPLLRVGQRVAASLLKLAFASDCE